MPDMIQPPPSAFTADDLKAMAKRYESCAPVARELVAVMHDYWTLLHEVQAGQRREAHAAATVAQLRGTVAEREANLAKSKEDSKAALEALHKQAGEVIAQHEQKAQGLEQFIAGLRQRVAALEQENPDLIARATEHYETRTVLENRVAAYAEIDPHFAHFLETGELPEAQPASTGRGPQR